MIRECHYSLLKSKQAIHFLFSEVPYCCCTVGGLSVPLTSLWDRYDCVHVLLCYGDCGVGDLCQQVHQVTYAIVNDPPVSGEAPVKGYRIQQTRLVDKST